jgi:hypothetical protein
VPSDAIWTGVITGAVGVAGMAATGLTAVRPDRRRARIEHERLRRQDETEQRKERGAAYYLRDEIVDAERRLVAAMRRDIGPHPAGSSEPD